MQRALVLGGGGITGYLYEVGVLAALEEMLPAGSFRDSFDIIVGTSAGAVAAALVANGARPADIYRVLREDADSPFNFRPADVYGTVSGGALRFLGQFARPFGAALARTVRRRRRPALASILKDFQEHHPPGFYSTAPLERTLCERFTDLGYAHRFRELGDRLYIAGADIDTGERLVFGAGDLRDVHICRAVAASCAIPIFFAPIRVQERDVVDGAVAGPMAVDIAVAHGARHVIYVNPLVPIRNDRRRLCLPRDDGHCARLVEKGVGWIGDQALRMLLAATLEDSLAALRARHPDLVVHGIEPGREELVMFMHNVMSFGARRELIDYGYACARRLADEGTADALGVALG